MLASSTCQKCGVKEHNTHPNLSQDLYSDSLLRLLRSNAVPIDVESNDLRTRLSSIEDDMCILKSHIEHLNAHLKSFQDQYDHLHRVAADHKAVLSPIRSLPVDILAEIFQWACDDANIAYSLNTKSTPWYLGQVCWQWRDAVLSLPSLWSTINIPQPPQRQHDVSIIQAHLSRTGNYPLRIHFHHHKYDMQKPYGRDILRLLLQQSHRWRSVMMSVPAEFLMDLENIRGAVPQLEFLQFEVSSDEWENFHINFFQDAPRLRSASFKGVLRVARQVDVPWGQLTEYKGIECIAGDHSEVLSLSHQIESCTLLRSGSYGTLTGANALPGSSVPPFCHARLRQLKIDEENILDVFSELPALEHLSIKYASAANPLQHVTSLLRRSNARLLSLEIRYIPANTLWSTLCALLELCPDLETLKLWTPGDVFLHLLEALTTAQPGPGAGSGVLLPRLEHLLISATYWMNKWTEPIYNFLLSRLGTPEVRRLKSMTLWYARTDFNHPAPPTATRHAFAPLTHEKGLKFDLVNDLWKSHDF